MRAEGLLKLAVSLVRRRSGFPVCKSCLQLEREFKQLRGNPFLLDRDEEGGDVIIDVLDTKLVTVACLRKRACHSKLLVRSLP